MILIDYQAIALSNLFMQIKNHTNIQIEVDLIRHMVLNSLRGIRSKFYREFGELVIACDDKNYWRKEKFPYYKANRAKAQESSDLDWNAVYLALNQIREELKEFFPYEVIQYPQAEADDIIAVLCQNYGQEIGGEPILIMSRDKDFVQLQKYGNVKQYDPINKSWIRNANPERQLLELIIRGDSGDGIPNILSADATYVTQGVRSKPLTQKKLDLFMSEGIPPEFERSFQRNKSLIDFTQIPVEIKEGILEMHRNAPKKSRNKLFSYFINNKLKLLQDSIGEF